MNLFDLYAKITLDTSEYENGLANTSKQSSGLASKLKSGLATAGKVAAAGIGVASTAVIALGKIGLDYNSQMEQYTTNFTTMLGSQEAAVKKVEELKEFAASTPLSMDDLANGTQTLLAFGVETENSTGILRQLGDIALGNADKMQRLSTAFGKATAQGKLSGEVVQQMIDAGWNPLIQISQAAGETMEETQKRMSAGAISVGELEAAMESVTTGTGQFAGGMESASHTMQGLISTLQDNVRSKIGEAFQSVSDKITGILPKVIEFVNSIDTDKIVTAVQNVANAFIEFLPVITAATTATLAYKAAAGIAGIIDAVKKATESQTIAQAALNAIMKANPFVLVATLIAAVGTALVTLYMTNEDFRNKVNAAWKTIKETISNAVSSIVNFFTVTIPGAAQKAVDWFKKIPDQMREVGANLLIGLWTGITDKVRWLKDKVGGIVDTIKGWFTGKDGFDEHSPSKWATSVGEYMMQGLAIGMENSKGELMETAASIIGEVKNRFSVLADALTLKQDVGDLEYELWERTDGVNASEAEKYRKKLSLLTKQQKDQKSIVEAAAIAYEEVVAQYGEGSKESLEYQKQLLQEKLAYQDLLDEINEVSTARKELYFSGLGHVDFANSTLAKVSAATINANSTPGNQQISLAANLMFGNGQKFASWILPDLIKAAKSNGTPIVNPT